MIRKSTENDRAVIQELMYACFGDKDNLEPYDNLDDRYYLYFMNGILIAMTGLTSDSEYGHLEIDWTCTRPEYRRKGCMMELFTMMLSCVHEPVYCSCWRLPTNDRANLHSLMLLFGFHEVVHTRIHYKVPHNCHRHYEGGCICCTGDSCECYLRYIQN